MRAVICGHGARHTQVITHRSGTLRLRMNDKEKAALDEHIAERHAAGWIMEHYSTSAVEIANLPEQYHDFIWRR